MTSTPATTVDHEAARNSGMSKTMQLASKSSHKRCLPPDIFVFVSGE